eukprot:7673651-Ditylum_brightwellii.AAC.1
MSELSTNGPQPLPVFMEGPELLDFVSEPLVVGGGPQSEVLLPLLSGLVGERPDRHFISSHSDQILPASKASRHCLMQCVVVLE